MHRTVNARRNGSRRPPRSESAPRIGDTIALSPTLTTIPRLRRKLPFFSPNWFVSVSHSPIAPETTAKLKIVLAKSYRAHAAGTRALPDGVSAASDRLGAARR